MTVEIELENEYEVIRYDHHVPVHMRTHKHTLGRFKPGEGEAAVARSPKSHILHVEDRCETWSEEHEDECDRVASGDWQTICNCKDIKKARQEGDDA